MTTADPLPDPMNWADLSTDPPDDPPPAPSNWVKRARQHDRARLPLDAPIHVGTVTAAERAAFGPLTLEVVIEPDRSGQVHVGGYVLAAGEAARLGWLLTVAAGALGAAYHISPIWRAK